VKVALVCDAAEQLGIQHISASLKRGNNQVKLFLDPSIFNDKIVFNNEKLSKYFDIEDLMVKEIINWSPEIVGISTVTVTYQWALRVAKKIKDLNPDILIIIGGPHANLTPESIIKENSVDIVCIGEGEEAVYELTEKMKNNKDITNIKNLYVKKDGEIYKNEVRHLNEDLDSIPYPDREIFEPYLNTKDSLLTISLRGCPYSCTYCSHNALKKLYHGKGKYVRRKSPEYFVNEMHYFKQKYNFKFVRIYDDIFTYDVNWLKEFVPLYKKYIDKPFFCLGHPNCLKEEAVRLISEAGCKWIQIGIESMNEHTRNNYLNRPEKNDTIINGLKTLDKYNIRYELDFIFGLPGDDEDTFSHTVDVLKKCKSLNRVSTLNLSFLPKTEIVNHFLEDDNKDEMVDHICKGLESPQTDKGSIRDSQLKKIAAEYAVLYRLCAFLPEKIINLFVSSKFYKILPKFNPFLYYFVRLLGVDKVDKIFLKEFTRQLIKYIFFRPNYYRKS